VYQVTVDVDQRLVGRVDEVVVVDLVVERARGRCRSGHGGCVCVSWCCREREVMARCDVCIVSGQELLVVYICSRLQRGYGLAFIRSPPDHPKVEGASAERRFGSKAGV
jgi:hypothetical protein